MRKIIFPLLGLVLAACTAPTPIIISAEELVKPTEPPEFIVQTIIVTVLVTSAPTEIPLATLTPIPSSTQVRAPEPVNTQLPDSSTTSTAVQAADNRIFTLDSALGGLYFPTITLTGKNLSLRCDTYKKITFRVEPSTPNITKVDFYYRIEDRGTGLILDWEGPRRMIGGTNGNFTLIFTGEDVKPVLRYPNAWLDFQFVGLDESGSRVGNSEKIVQQVSYTVDCP